jgi:hypothetical protein
LFCIGKARDGSQQGALGGFAAKKIGGTDFLKWREHKPDEPPCQIEIENHGTGSGYRALPSDRNTQGGAKNSHGWKKRLRGVQCITRD